MRVLVGSTAAVVLGLLGCATEERPLTRYDRPPDGATRVLWIGTEHTRHHSVPHRVQEIVEDAGGTPVYVRLVSEGDNNLYGNLDDPDYALAVAENPWDLVVIEQSQWQQLTNSWWQRDTLQRVRRDAGDVPMLYIEAWSSSTAADELWTPAFAQRHLDRQACTVAGWGDPITVVMAGHDIHEARESGVSVLDADGRRLSGSGADEVARRVAHALRPDQVPAVGASTASVCAASPPYDGPIYADVGRLVSQHGVGRTYPVVMIETAQGVATWNMGNDDELAVRGKPLLDVVDRLPRPGLPYASARHWHLPDRPGRFATTRLPPEGALAGAPYQMHWVDEEAGRGIVSMDHGLWILGSLVVNPHGDRAVDPPADLARWSRVLRSARARGVTRSVQHGYAGEERIDWTLRYIEGLSNHLAQGASEEAFGAWARALDPPAPDLRPDAYAALAAARP